VCILHFIYILHHTYNHVNRFAPLFGRAGRRLIALEKSVILKAIQPDNREIKGDSEYGE